MRTTPKQDRGQKTINHIIDTAEKLFTEKGYERVSTNLIAQKADMAIGSLYRYFSNKQAILHYMVQKYT